MDKREILGKEFENITKELHIEGLELMAEAKWLTKETIDSVKWLPADITLIDRIKQSL